MYLFDLVTGLVGMNSVCVDQSLVQRTQNVISGVLVRVNIRNKLVTINVRVRPYTINGSQCNILIRMVIAVGTLCVFSSKSSTLE